jgi:hypothetical protein
MDIPASDAPPASAATAQSRTEEVLAKVVGSAKVESAAAQDQATAPAEEAAPASTAQVGDEAKLRKELRNAIATAWTHVPPETRASILTREFAKGSLPELTTEQLQYFLEETPRLLEEAGCAVGSDE